MAETKEPEKTDTGGDDTEKAFWDKFDKRLDERIDAGVERAIKKFRVTSNSRSGRTTLPSIFANAMFGKETSKEE